MADFYTNGHLDDANLKGVFFEAVGSAAENAWWRDIANVIDSDRETENHKWIGHVPVMREWLGGRNEQQLNKYSLNVTNSKFESTLPISKNDLRRDKSGLINLRVGDMGTRAALYPQVRLSTFILNGEAGTSGLAYDGQFFFDTDHNESGTNQTNDLGAAQVPASDVTTATAPTADEAAAIIVQTVGHMHGLTDDQGEPINQDANDWIIMVGTAPLWAGFKRAVTLNNLASGATNPVTGLTADGMTFRVIHNPRLSASTAKAYFFRANAPVKPFLVQEEEPIMTDVLGEGSDELFKNDRYLFGATWRGGFSYLAWQQAALVTLT